MFNFCRPFFTYWVTFVQIVIYVIAVLVHGIAPVGFEETEVTSEVMECLLLSLHPLTVVCFIAFGQRESMKIVQ